MTGKREDPGTDGGGSEGRAPSALLWWIGACAALLLVVFLHGFPIINSDFFWHLETGELIVETHSIPREDPFSYTAAGAKWVTHEWLFEVVTWLVYSIGSYEAVCILKLIVIMLAIWFPISLWRGTRVSPLWVFICASTGVVMLLTRSFWRPHLLSILMFSIFFKVLEDYAERRSNRLWLLPCLTIVWANWHSGVVLGVLLVLVYAVIDLLTGGVRQDSYESRTAWKALALTAVISLGCALINPNTIDALLYPFRLIESYSSTYGRAAAFWELQPIRLDMVPSFWYSVALVVVGVVASWGRMNVRHVLILAGLIAASIYRLRMIELYIPAFIAFGPGLIQGLTDRVSGRMGGIRSPAVNALVGAAALAIVAGLSLKSVTGPPVAMGLDEDLFPVACADWVEEHDPPGYMYNHIDNGGYLIHRLYPDHLVFWDNRLLVFEPLFERLLAGETIEDIHHIDWVIDVNSDVNPYTPDEWALMAFDEGYSLYIKRSGAAGRLIGTDEYVALYPCHPEDDFRNARDYPQEVKDRIVTELDRLLVENRTRNARSYAAGMFIMLGDEYPARARDLIEDGLTTERTYVNYHYYSALYDYTVGDLDRAERTLRSLLFWHPRSIESRFLLGRTLASGQNYDGARRIFDRVISDGYTSPGLLYEYASVLHELGNDNRAAEMLEGYFQTVAPRDYETREYADAIALGHALMGDGSTE